MPSRDATPGESVLRLEDERFLRGRGRYTADHHRPGEAHAVVVRAPHAHAAIRAVDLDAARAMPGVLGVFADADLAEDGLGTFPCAVKFEATRPLVVPPRRVLARERVRYVGEPVAFVVAESLTEAMDAAEAVEIDYDALPAVVDAADALHEDAPQLWDEAPGNLAFVFERGDNGATERAFAAAAHVVELPIVNNRVAAVPMEPRAAIAEADAATGALRLEVTGQGVHGIRDALSKDVLHVDPETLAVFAEDVGGGFGLKNFPYPEHALLLWAARRLGRPVRWMSTNADDLMGAVHARAQTCRGRLALDASGRFLGLDVAITANLGAYASTVGPGSSTVAPATAMGGVYDIPAIAMTSRGAFTNTAPVDAYRGAGKPEANFIVERLIDAAARQCGFDPVALRRMNVVETFPYRKALGAVMDCGAFAAAIDAAAAAADTAGFAARRDEAAARGRLRGLGVACFLESARGSPAEEAGVRFAADGMIEIVTGTESNGQGHETAFTQVAAARLGLPMERFRFVQADTRRTRMGNGHGGARSMHMGGGTLALALEQMLETAGPIAAQLLQADADSVVYEAGRFVVRDAGGRGGDGRAVSLAEVAGAAAGAEVGPAVGLDTLVRREDAPITFPSGCHVAEVEVDPGTGVVTIVRYVAVDDYGRMVNPMLTLGRCTAASPRGSARRSAKTSSTTPPGSSSPAR